MSIATAAVSDRAPFCRVSAAYDDEVVGIGDDLRRQRRRSPGEPPVLEEAVHVQVGQQRADGSSNAKDNLRFPAARCLCPRQGDHRRSVGQRDAVPDDYFIVADENFLDKKPHDALAF